MDLRKIGLIAIIIIVVSVVVVITADEERPNADEEFLNVKVEGVYLTGQGFKVVLERDATSEILPISISRSQARSIQLGLSENEPPRPLTHDIFLQVIEDQDLSVDSVAVDNLENGIFTAELKLVQGDDVHLYDVRPSDGIALAVRKDADILVSENVMEKAGERKDDNLQFVRVES